MNALHSAISPQNIVVIKNLVRELSEKGQSLTPDDIEPLKENEAFKNAIATFFDGFRCAGRDGNGNLKIHNTVIPAVVAEYVRNEYQFVIIDNLFYIYNNGAYIRDTVDNIRISLYINNLILPEYRSKHRTAEVIAELKTPDRCKALEDMNAHPAHYICFRNGVYDPVKHQMLPHSPEYLFINQIPFDYDPDADPKGDKIEAFFDSIKLTGDKRIMFLSYVGYCLTTDTRMQKFIVLKGRPGTGKSKILNLVKHIVGENNCSAESLEDLNENRFRAYNVLGRICNINADLTTEGTFDPAIIKQLVGEDSLSVERKGGQAFRIRPYAKYLFAMNNFPIVRAKDESFYRRVLLLSVDTIPEKPDEGLEEKLKSQADYVVHQAVDALSLYYSCEDKSYIESEESKDLVNQWKQKGDSVAAFLAEEDPFCGHDAIPRSDLFADYKSFCLDNDRKPLGRNGFYDSLRAKGYYDFKTSVNQYFTAPQSREGSFATTEETPFNN